MTWEQFSKIGQSLPEVTEELWYRRPSLKVRGKGFASLKEEGVVSLMVEDLDEQELLLRTQPETYFITDHYRGHPWVLARLSKLRVGDAKARLRKAWERQAPKALKAG